MTSLSTSEWDTSIWQISVEGLNIKIGLFGSLEWTSNIVFVLKFGDKSRHLISLIIFSHVKERWLFTIIWNVLIVWNFFELELLDRLDTVFDIYNHLIVLVE